MPYVTLKGDKGQSWRLKYTMESLRWFETESGQSFIAVFAALDQGTWTFTQLSYLVAAAIKHARTDEVSLADGDKVIEAVGLKAALEAVGAAVKQSAIAKGLIEEGAAGDGDGGAEKNAGTGTSNS